MWHVYICVPCVACSQETWECRRQQRTTPKEVFVGVDDREVRTHTVTLVKITCAQNDNIISTAAIQVKVSSAGHWDNQIYTILHDIVIYTLALI